MDIGTHALASLALSRAIMPRAPKLLWAWTIPAGVIADSDGLSASLGPASYLAWHRTYLHSFAASLIIGCVLAAVYRLAISNDLQRRLPVRNIFIAVLLAQWLHLGMDALQWQGTELLWPLRRTRFAADWLPSVDPWIIALLVSCIALPEFFRLVSSEIGAKDRRPPGFAGAIIGLALVTLYIGLRADLHADAVAQLQNRVYVGEAPRRVAALSGLTSMVTWSGLADTESAMHEVAVRIGSPRAALDPGVNLFKPEPSPLLQTAENSQTGKLFLRVARFPKATVQTMDAGVEIQIRDLTYTAAGESNREPMVAIDFDRAGKLLSETVTWAGAETPR